MRGWAGRRCRPADERRLALGSARANLDRGARCELQAFPRAERTELALVAVLGSAPTAEGRAALACLGMRSLTAATSLPAVARPALRPQTDTRGTSCGQRALLCGRDVARTLACGSVMNRRTCRACTAFMYSAQRLSSPECESGRSPL